MASSVIMRLRRAAQSDPAMARRWACVGDIHAVVREKHTRDEIKLGYLVTVEKTTSGVIKPKIHYDRIYKLSLNGQPCRIMIRGPSGAGKTKALVRILVYLYFNFGFMPIILIDPKSELNFRKELNDVLLPGEKPRLIKSRIFKPSFICDDDSDPDIFCMGIHDFTAIELLRMKYKNVIPSGIAYVLRRGMILAKEEYGSKYTLNQLDSVILESVACETGVAEKSVNGALLLLKDLKMTGRIIYSRTNHDILKCMRDGIMPIFQYDMKHDDDELITSNFVSALMRNIHKRACNLKHTSFTPLFVACEARLIVHPKKNLPSKETIYTACKMGRGLDISTLFDFQDFSIDLDPGIMSQASVIINIGKIGIDSKILSTILPHDKIVEIDQICRVDHKTGIRIGCAIDMATRNVTYFVPALPQMTFR